jgi:signal transduction histidine kinase
MTPAARVLFIGQDAADASLLTLVLARDLPGTEVAHLTDAVAFRRELERADFDLVVCDERFGWGTAARVLLEARRRRPQATVVVLTETEPWLVAETTGGGHDTALRKSSATFLALPDLLRATLERAAVGGRGVSGEPQAQTLLVRSGIGIFRLTLDGRLLAADETFLRLVGARSLEEARELSFSALTPRLARGFTESDKIHRQRQRLRGPQGEERGLSLVQVVSLDEDGLPVLDGLAELASDDVGAADLAAEASRLARSNEELRMFAALAAHELKEPLRTIEQATRALREEVGGPLGGDAERSADQVVLGVRRLQSMIEGLLTLARFGGGEGRLEPCDCNELVEEVLSGLRAGIDETGAKVNVKPLPTVRADPTQLRVLFRNLISNAMQFHGAAPPRIRVAARQHDGDWVFSVEDEGIGIAVEESERIFEQFTRATAGGGAGLGLAICKQVVERHGGRIWVESEPRRGSTFFFTIPLSTSGRSDALSNGDSSAAARLGGARSEAG